MLVHGSLGITYGIIPFVGMTLERHALDAP